MTNTPKLKLIVDLALALGFVVLLIPGLSLIHPLLGIAIATGLALHLLLHGKWIVAMAKSFRTNLPSKVRVNVVLDLILALLLTNTIASGLALWLDPSEAAAAPDDARSRTSAPSAAPEPGLRGARQRGAPWAQHERGGTRQAVSHSHPVHHASAILLVATLAVHIGLHGKWLLFQTRQLLAGKRRPADRAGAATAGSLN